MSETIQLTSSDGFVFPAYVARPAGKAKGAVVVLQEIFGVNSHIRSVADGYAEKGYLAIAPATFHRVQQGVDLGYTAEDIQSGAALKARVEALPAPGVMPDIEAAIKYAAQAGKVGMTGYCWGGLLAWRSACLLDGLAAVAPYYGGGMTVGMEPDRKPLCPVLCHFGDKDQHITIDTVEAFKKAHPRVEVQIYHADHGFNCEQRGSYDAPSAKLARERTLAFFAQHVD
ncbi:MAG: dienelactone hydrolase family protein [Rhodoferax sp.]|nr:dienelactone hydrolase family protein [Rhodoferax sp.]